MLRAGRGVVVSLWRARLGAGVLACMLALGVLLVGGVSSAGAAPKQVIDSWSQDGPGGVAVNQASGDVYVVAVNSDTVERFDAGGSLLSSIGGPCSSPSTCAEGEFSFGGALAGVAVAPDGSVYVADTANHRVQKFTADGTFVLTFGLDVDPGGGASVEVCTSGCQRGVAGSGAGELSAPIGVAVDPTTGDVLVAERDNQRVQRFDSTGTFVSLVAGGLSDPRRVAVDSTGAIYVLEHLSRVLKLASDGAPGTTFAPSLISPNGDLSPSELAIGHGVVPADDRVFVVQLNPASGGLSGEVLELDTAGGLVETHRLPWREAAGLAVHSSSGRVYVAENNFNIQRILVLGVAPQTATIRDTTDVTATSATLNGTVNPGGGLPVGYHFEASADNGATWTRFPVSDVPVGDGSADIDVSQPATDLQPGTDYLVRLVASNEFGATVVSGVDAFTTPVAPPFVTTLKASQLRPRAAQLVGEVNPNSLPTTYHFEYGTTTGYGTSVPVPDASAGDEGAFVTVTQQISNLAPGTVYHYRLVATNSAGTTPGEDRMFTTRALDPDPAGPRAYELVSPADKVGGTGVGHWYGGPDAAGLAGFAAWDGERFAVHGTLGSVLIEGKMTFIDDWSFAERTPAGWVNKPGLSKRTFGVEAIADAQLTNAAGDFSLTAFVGAHVMRLFPEMENWPDLGVPMLRRWTEDGWEVFGPFDPFDPAQGSNLGSSSKAIAEDGSAVATSSPWTRGLAGPGDPSLDLVDLGDPDSRDDDPSSVYLDEITGPFTDVFPGDDRVRELVNVCTEGTLIPVPGGAGPCPAKPANRDASLISPGGASLTPVGGDTPSSVFSADGSRLFFMSPTPALSGFGPAQLYVRQRNSDGKVLTRWVSQSEVEDQADSLRAPALFEGASRDGDKVFFRTTSPLTADDPNQGVGTVSPDGGVISGQPSAQSSDLYMYDIPDGPDGNPSTPDGDPAGGDLTRISAGPDGTGDCSSPGQPSFAALRFASHDASRVYFACAAPLAGAVATDSGNITSPGGTPTTSDAVNLYLYDASEPVEQRWRFVARLPRSGVIGACATTAAARGSSLAASPGGTGDSVSLNDKNSCVRGVSDGSLVTLFTAERLTADDPDGGSLDIYAYDPVRDELTRISAPQGGPDGTYPCQPGQETGVLCHADPGIGPGPMPLEMLNVATRPDSGADLAFFHSAKQLVAEDTDDAYDVYQWRSGELSLISTGRSETDGAFYLGNDRTGQNVYFATRDQLTWQDKDRVLDVYTARIDGGIPEPVKPTPCESMADRCQAPGAGPEATKIGSGSAGSGNKALRPKKALFLRRLSAAQRRAAAKRGVIAVRVRSTHPALIKVTARAKIARKGRTVAKGQKRLRKATTTTIRLRLNTSARKRLRAGKTLKLTIVAKSRGAQPKAITAKLKRRQAFR
jgi:NHL repeat